MDSRIPRPRSAPGTSSDRPLALQVPPLDLEVVEWLEKVVPEVCPAAPSDLQDLHWHLGRRALVKFIRAQWARQQEQV